MITETKLVTTFLDERGRLCTKVNTVDMTDLRRILDLLDEVAK